MLIIQFHTTKSLSYNSIHQVSGENACHTIFRHFRKTIEKKLNHFCRFLRTIEQTGDKKIDFKSFFLNKMFTIPFPYTTQKFSQVILKICPESFFVFFQPLNEFSNQTKVFRKNSFCMQSLIFLCA